ncbi:sulfate transporter CysZ [Dongshaea marina]|uniref:sulfate transporter CysZ n=1 Tax=Dongshaea marina TaxID=2047966 RepID=UPI000D3E83E7|nr:sulfate transporter CysZ [Dongshaea marina]
MRQSTSMVNDSVSGAEYLLRGFSLVRKPGIRRFVLIPLLVNLLLFIGAFYWLFLQFEGLLQWIDSFLPSWLTWLNYLLIPLAVITILVVFSFIFSAVANWIAAPFNGLLAERVELMLTGQPTPDASIAELIAEVPRTLKREWKKLLYYLPRLLGCLILSFIPLLGQTLGPVVWFVFNAWMMAIQYCDYPFDNHKVDFPDMREALARRKGKCLSFGALTMLLSAIPVLNLFIMPVAVCGATAMWVEQYRNSLVPIEAK